MMFICSLLDSRLRESQHIKIFLGATLARVILFGLVLMASLQGCRIARLGKDYPDGQTPANAAEVSAEKTPLIQPQKQDDAGSVLNLTFDQSGKLTETLTLRLDYFPTPRPDGVSVPTCYKEISGHLVIGRLICSANGNLAMDVIASQVNQQCYLSDSRSKIEAKSAIILTGCVGPAILRATRFDPDLKIEVGH